MKNNNYFKNFVKKLVERLQCRIICLAEQVPQGIVGGIIDVYGGGNHQVKRQPVQIDGHGDKSGGNGRILRDKAYKVR